MRTFGEGSARGETLSNQLRRDYTSAYMSLLNGDLETFNLVEEQLIYETLLKKILKSEDIAKLICQLLGHERSLLQCSVVVDKYPITHGWYRYGHSMTLVGEYGFDVWNLFRDTRGLYVQVEKVMFHVGKGSMIRLAPEFRLDRVEDLLNINHVKGKAMIGEMRVTTIPRVTFGVSSAPAV